MTQLWRNQLNNRLVTSGLNDTHGKSEFQMADAAEGEPEQPKKKSKLPLLIGVVLAIALGGGSFFAVYSGMILGGGHEAAADPAKEVSPLPDVAFVPVEPVIVTLGPGAANRHLKFTAQVEVEAAHAADVTLLLPRILDVFNSHRARAGAAFAARSGCGGRRPRARSADYRICSELMKVRDDIDC
jgi:flagellar protein FliL